jgi:hypothetical protein
MTKRAEKLLLSELNNQGANALLAAIFTFLRRNKISKKSIVALARKYPTARQQQRYSRLYSELLRAYEDMGVIMATWFSDPRFLDASGQPLSLSKGKGPNSIAHLINVSRTQVELSVALKLMTQSPSIKFNSNGTVAALRRVFVLPELELPRAAFVVERYLDTLQRNASARKKKTTLLLERSCHASEVDLATISPMLRDIEDRGTAFMDSIDGEIEGRRLRRATQKNIGELGVLVFAWTKSTNNAARIKKTPPAPVAPRKSKKTRANTSLRSRNPRP